MSNTHKLSRSEQSRINGAKSRGPVSPAGKARSSQNNIRHGFSAIINVVLRVEDKSAFDRHAAGLHTSFKPQDYAEHAFVDQLAAISWRQVRLMNLETALIDAQVDFQFDHVTAINPDSAHDPYFHLVQAWQALARHPQKPDTGALADPTLPPDGYDISSIELLRRYQTSLDRQYRNTLLNLQQYRKNFAPSAPETPTEQVKPEIPNPTPVEQSELPPIPRPIRTLTLLKPVPAAENKL